MAGRPEGESSMAVLQEELAPPVSQAAAVPVAKPGTRRLGAGLAIAGWAFLALMWTTGSVEVFGHDQGNLQAIPALGLFLVGWLVMVAAMMLPSSLPTLARVDWELGLEARSGSSGFLTGYFFAWAGFGAATFAGDGILHMAVERMPWIAQRPGLIVGGVAVFAGAAEMLGRPAPPLLPSVSREGSPFALGKGHAFDRIRRCWPLMLFAMAVGMSSPGWMVGLTLVMALELRPRASAALRLIGVCLFGIGAAVVIEPGITSMLLGSA